MAGAAAGAEAAMMRGPQGGVGEAAPLLHLKGPQASPTWQGPSPTQSLTNTLQNYL